MPIRQKQCPTCGQFAPLDANVCANCGRPFAGIIPAREPHDISVAAMLSILLPGGGELYNGQAAKGALLTALFVLPLAIAFITHFWPLALVGPIVWCVSVTDASIIAGRRIRGETVTPWQWF